MATTVFALWWDKISEYGMRRNMVLIDLHPVDMKIFSPKFPTLHPSHVIMSLHHMNCRVPLNFFERVPRATYIYGNFLTIKC